MSSGRRNWLGITLIVVGVLLLAGSLLEIDVEDISRVLFPLLLIAIGVGFFFGRPRVRPPALDELRQGLVGNVKETVADDRVDISNIIGKVNLHVTSRSFRGGSVSTIVGDMTVDCFQGGWAEGEQVLVLNGVLGKIRVNLPAGAAVKIAAHTLVGKTRVFEQDRNGFSATVIYATPGYAAASHRLRIDIANVVGEIIVR